MGNRSDIAGCVLWCRAVLHHNLYQKLGKHTQEKSRYALRVGVEHAQEDNV